MEKKKQKKTGILILLLVFMLAACSQNYEEDMFDINKDLMTDLSSREMSIDSELTFSSWKDLINNFVDGEGSEWFKKQNIELLGYEVVNENVILSTSDLSVSDETIMPIYDDTCNVNKFCLVSIADARKMMNPANMIDYSLFKETLLSPYVGKELKVVKLLWEYNSQKHTTSCLISNNSVVYDDFLMNIRTVEIKKADDLVVPTKLQLTRNESDGTSIRYYFFSDEVTWRLLGTEVARAFCTMTVNGVKKAEGKSIESHSPNYHTTAKVGFKAISEIKVNGFKTGTSGHCDYGYGIAAGPAGISISWNGSSASFSGGGNSRGGGAYVSPSQLD